MPIAQYAGVGSLPADAGLSSGPPADVAPAKPKRRTQIERKEEAERRLLDAALVIVAERGSERLTLADVGEAAGYSRGLPLHYFGSKEGLLRALAEHIRERFTLNRESAVKDAPGLGTILGTIDYYFSRGDTKWTPTRAGLVMFTESLLKNSALAESMRAYNHAALTFIEGQIREGIKRKEIDADADPRASAVIIMGAMRGVMLQWLNDRSIDIAAVRKQTVVSIERMLKAPGSSKPTRKAVR